MSGSLSDGSSSICTKFVLCPVVRSTPLRVSTLYYIFIGKAAAFVFFVFAEGCKYQRAYIFIPKIAQRILIVLVWNITIHS